jgi:hypothetical protein
MKTIQLIFLLAGFGLNVLVSAQEVALKNSTDAVSPAVSGLDWDKTTIDVGVIKQNNPVEVNYSFTNTNNEPVVITDVQTSCGCTAAKHSQEPLKPGDSSTITVTYNAKSIGVFHKSITVKTSNGADPVILTLAGEVK